MLKIESFTIHLNVFLDSALQLYGGETLDIEYVDHTSKVVRETVDYENIAGLSGLEEELEELAEDNEDAADEDEDEDDGIL